MTQPPQRAELERSSTTAAAVNSLDLSSVVDNGRANDMTNSSNVAPAGVDNVAFFRPATDDKSGRLQLPPSTLTPAQFEMNYGTPTAVAGATDDGMSSKENLLTPRG